MNDEGGWSQPCPCLVGDVDRYCSCRRRLLYGFHTPNVPVAVLLPRAMGATRGLGRREGSYVRGGRGGVLLLPGPTSSDILCSESLKHAAGIHSVRID